MNTRNLKPWIAIALLACFAPAASALNPILKELEDTYVRLGEEVGPSVVNIDVQDNDGSRSANVPNLFHFFGIPEQEGDPEGRPAPMPRSASGSGFIIDNQGHILTNNHVISQADKIVVTLYNGETYEAELIGSDPQTDIAVIKIDADGELPVAKLGDSANLKPGQFAIAIGSPQGLEGSMSFGHITALGREGLRLPNLRFQGFIQTDAAINLGNSGGPLCNIDGEVIGINVAIVFGANSIGFAIPVNTAKSILTQLISTGRVSRGFLGVQIKDAEEYREAMGLPDRIGAFVEEVQEETPASRAGVRRYDVIRGVDGKEVASATDLIRTISSYAPGTDIELEIWRDGKTMTKEVSLAEYSAGEPVVRPVTEVNNLGVRVREIPDELRGEFNMEDTEAGVIISDIDPVGPAWDAGLRQGDVIVEIARQPVTSVEEFQQLVSTHGVPGSKFVIRVVRRGGLAAIVPIDIPLKQE